MKEYTVIYKSGRTEEVAFRDRNALIRHHFKGDIRHFKKEVKLLKWSTLSMQYVENVEIGKINAEISTADVNPYSWRV